MEESYTVYSWDSLPLILNADDVRKILKGNSAIYPSKDTVFTLMHSNGFPLIKGTKELKVSKDALKQWLINLH